MRNARFVSDIWTQSPTDGGGLAEGSMSLGMGLGNKMCSLLLICSLCFMLILQDASSQLSAPAMPVPCYPSCHGLWPSGTISPTRLFTLQVTSVLRLYHNNRKVINTLIHLWVLYTTIPTCQTGCAHLGSDCSGSGVGGLTNPFLIGFEPFLHRW